MQLLRQLLLPQRHLQPLLLLHPLPLLLLQPLRQLLQGTDLNLGGPGRMRTHQTSPNARRSAWRVLVHSGCPALQLMQPVPAGRPSSNSSHRSRRHCVSSGCSTSGAGSAGGVWCA